MVLKDGVGVFLVKSEAEGNERLAGIINPMGTIAGILFYSIGANNLTHQYGAWGYLGLIPVLVVDYIDGRFFTAVGRYIESDQDTGSAGIGEIWNGIKAVSRQWWNAFCTKLKKGN
jgi:hypothetical protein